MIIWQSNKTELEDFITGKNGNDNRLVHDLAYPRMNKTGVLTTVFV